MSVTALAPAVEIPASAAAGNGFVRLEHVSKRFVSRRTWRQVLRAPFQRRYTQALSDVSCTIPEGEFFGLLGPNGAGKTTLFKILATLVLPDDGHAIVGGYDAARDVDHVRRLLVPVVADERSLRWRLSAWENLRLHAVLYRVPRREIRRRIEEVLEIVGLGDTEPKMVGQFSSGMKQRLLIARALLAKPRVLLLDEPTRGLDPLSARSLRTFLKEDICRRQGCTVLLATHNAEEAFHLCDRVGILDKGRLLNAAPAERLMDAFTDERYQLWTRAADHPALVRLASLGLAADVGSRRADQDGWQVVEMRVPGGHEGASRLLESLIMGGMDVSRFERVQLTLAELIERVQHSARGEGRA